MEPLVELFEGLSKQTVGSLDASHLDRVTSICSDLQSTKFLIPAPFELLACHVLGIEESASPFPTDYDDSVVISPFISSEFFTRVLPSSVGLLVSRFEQFKQVEDVVNIKERNCFEDGSTPDMTEGPRGPAEPIRGLHAKVFGFESEQEQLGFWDQQMQRVRLFVQMLKFFLN